MDGPEFNNSVDGVDSYAGAAENETYVPYSQRPETYIVPVVFALIFLVGVIGNGTLILIFVRHRVMRNVPNTYILCLALGDLLVIVTTVPFISTIYTIESWPWGGPICKLSEASKDISIGVSVFTLTMLSAERYCAIVNPIRRHISTKALTLIIIMVIWLVSVLLAIPAVVFTSVEEGYIVNSNETVLYCTPFPKYLSKGYSQGVVIFRFLVYYVIPLCVIAGFYSLMARHLVLSTYNLPGEQGQQQSSQIQARKKVAKMILTIVIIFVICFLPSHVFSLWFHFSPNAYNDFDDFWNVFRIVGFCLSFINSCVNPIALYFISKAFRRYFNHYLFSYLGSSPRKLTDISMNHASSSSRRQNSVTACSNYTLQLENT